MNAAALDKSLGITPSGLRQHGYIYAVRDDASQAVKIGFSKNPEARIRQLQTGSAAQLRLVALFRNVRSFEAYLHRSFQSRRMSGEWFDDADYGVSAILRMSVEEGDAA